MVFASNDLREEHEGVLAGLSILERMGEAGNANIEDAREIAEFFALFADKCHHGKEEGHLFPALEKAGIPKEHGPIGQMLAEHVLGRTFISSLRLAAQGDGLDRAAFQQAAKGYVQLMRPHIEKENNVLFPMGDRMIPQEEQQRLLSAFEQHEESVMGPGVHEHLHEVLHRLSEKYKLKK